MSRGLGDVYKRQGINAEYGDVRRAIAANVKVGLGTDMSGGYTASMWDAIRLAIVASTVKTLDDQREPLSYNEAFYLATKGGADALDLGDKIGSFAAGKRFDALVLNVVAKDSPIDVFEGQTVDEQWQKMVFCGDDRCTEEVYVDGVLIGGTLFANK
eukprot:TRINITY_DN4733_c0_g1_i1.p3 TRINITY_DN4733_c0_g1~~TRINITY_DN4733_c0_g1_i1.p3  ORF type:complete len:157 (+),score=50.07 TRINITY_DN4733_c0_g1_i1:2-472(+)